MTIKEMLRISYEQDRVIHITMKDYEQVHLEGIVVPRDNDSFHIKQQSRFSPGTSIEPIMIHRVDSIRLIAKGDWWHKEENLIAQSEAIKIAEDIMSEKNKQIDELLAENAELKRSAGEPVAAKEHDIAKERWGWFHGKPTKRKGLYRGNQLLVIEEYATDTQKKLVAAAPELADMLRQLIHQEVITDSVLVYMVTDAMLLLRGLGVPNVAPWYKETL